MSIRSKRRWPSTSLRRCVLRGVLNLPVAVWIAAALMVALRNWIRLLRSDSVLASRPPEGAPRPPGGLGSSSSSSSLSSTTISPDCDIGPDHRYAVVSLHLYDDDAFNSDARRMYDCFRDSRRGYAHRHDDTILLDERCYAAARDELLPLMPWMNASEKKWEKLRFLEYVMRTWGAGQGRRRGGRGLEWILWMDADAMFTNSNASISSKVRHFVREWRARDGSVTAFPLLVVGSDRLSAVNSGVMLLEASSEALDLMRRIYRTEAGTRLGDRFRDQQAMVRLLERHPRLLNTSVYVLEKYDETNALQTFGPKLTGKDWTPEDWNLHLAGYKMRPEYGYQPRYGPSRFDVLGKYGLCGFNRSKEALSEWIDRGPIHPSA